MDAVKKTIKIRFKYPPHTMIEIVPDNWLQIKSCIKKGTNGKKRSIHLGYRVFLFQTWVINNKDKIPKIGYTNSLKRLFISIAKVTDSSILRLFCAASFVDIAMAKNAL